MDKKRSKETSAKFVYLLESLQKLLSEGHKAIVFSQFTSLLKLLKVELKEKGISFLYLDGQTNNRRELVDKFQNSKDTSVFLMSLKAGGYGLNLTAADYVFILDPWWNPATESQAIDRAHRIGQKNSVFAYRLIVKDSIEEKIVKLQSEKKSLADAIIEGDSNLLRDLSASDLQVLFQ